MAGLSITKGGKLPIAFRVDRGNNAARCQFETLSACRDEDSLRAKRLRRAATKYPDVVDGVKARALADTLQAAGEGGKPPESLASSVHMRGTRILVAGHLWMLMAACRPGKVRGFTIIPKTWEFTAEELMGVDPRILLNRLLAAIYAKGGGKARGWVYVYLHGEWDPIGKVYRLHVHGFAYGDMVKVIDRLRGLPNYRTQRYLKNGKRSPVYRRVRVTRKKLRNLPRPITYRVQAYWPSKALIISDDGCRIRARTRQRISEPQHSQVLLWLDQWRIEDLTLMIGLRMTKHGLKQTKPVS